MAQAASSYPGEEKRRSTRISQAVPVIVRGVDLLGQPFEERTSTLTVNFHGCKYASKHHLPKNTWLTLELPQTEGESERRCVRARVVWIQRPRTTRELFQIGIELETAASVWGMSFEPEDWARPGKTEASVRARELAVVRPGTEPQGEIPASLAGYIEFLLAEAKRQSPDAREAAPSRAAETMAQASPLLEELQAQLAQRMDEAMEAVTAPAAGETRRPEEADDRGEQRRSEAFLEKWREQFEQEQAGAREELHARLAAQLASAQEEFRSGAAGEAEATRNEFREALAQLERHGETLRNEIRSALEDAAAKSRQIRAEMESEFAHRRTPEPAGEPAADWRQRLESEMSVAQAQWHELLQSSLDSAAQRLVGQLAESSQSALAAAEQKMTARLADLSQSLAQSTAESRESLLGARASLDQEVARARASLGDIEKAAGRVSEYSAQLEAASQDTINELHRRLETILSAQTAELNRRAESLAAGFAERLGPLLDTTGEQFFARSIAQVESKLASQLERTHESLRQLAARTGQAEETVRVHRERLRQASEHNQQEAAVQMAATLEQLRHDFEAARREALAKWAAELDAHATNASHSAFESMVKASEWHQQQARSGMDALVGEALEKAGAKLQEKSGESSREFVQGLGQLRKQHLEETRGEFEAASAESLGRTRGQLDAAMEAAAAKLGEVLREVSERASDEFHESSRRTVEAKSAELSAAAEAARSALDNRAAGSFERFQAGLDEKIERSQSEAQKALAAQLASTMESFAAQRRVYEAELLEGLDRLGGESAKQYEEHLRTVCDSWVASSVRQLSENGRSEIESLTRSSEQALRNTFSRMFDGLAEMMREKLQGAVQSRVQAATPPGEPPTAPSEKHFPA
jgi:hypothetical protein